MAIFRHILLSTPGIVFDLSVASVTDTTITLSFTQAGQARSYEYQLSSVSGSVSPFAWSALPSDKTITGLSASTQYFIRVRAVNGQIRGHHSNEAVATTSATASNPLFDNAAFIAGDTGSFTCSGSNRLLLVAVCYAAGNIRTVTGVTYNGVAMTSVGSLNNTTDGANNAIHLWRLVAPASGSNTVTATLSGPPATTALVVASYTGANQTTPLGTPTTGSGSNAAQPSVTVTSATNELVADFLCTLNSSADTFTAGSNQTKRASGDDSDEIGGACSEESGASSVVMNWTSPARYWSQIGVSVKGA